MRAKAIAAALAVSAATMVVAGGAAAKSPGGNPISRRPGVEVIQQFSLKGTNGYDVGVKVLDGRELTLSALSLGKGLGIAGVEYKLKLPRKTGPDEIVARVGNLGDVNVRFVHSKTVKTKFPAGCSGGDSVTEEGHFVGRITFRGEHGFTRVDARHAKGTVIAGPPPKCHVPTPHPQQGSRLQKKSFEVAAGKGETSPEVESVTLHATTSMPAATLKATRISGTEKNGKKVALATFFATAERRLGQISEKGVAVVLFAGGGTFLSPEPLDPKSDLVIEPPAPFAGSATYRQETPGRAHWSGDLKVDMPGFGPVPLAGRRSQATATLHRSGG